MKILTCLTVFGMKDPAKNRSKRQKIDRDAPWNFVMSWSPKLFKRQLRMSREDFFILRDKCLALYPGRYSSGSENYRMAMGNLSGGSISLEIKLAITLRLLAGASYLDMCWYGVSVAYVHSIFEDMLNLLNRALPDDKIFGMEYTPQYLNKLSSQWSSIMMKKRGHDLMKGTILAGDGLVIAVNAPSQQDRYNCKVLDITHFRNRKGCFGIICQAFCDAYRIFRVVEIKWPGATNDITAYKQTDLYLC